MLKTLKFIVKLRNCLTFYDDQTLSIPSVIISINYLKNFRSYNQK